MIEKIEVRTTKGVKSVSYRTQPDYSKVTKQEKIDKFIECLRKTKNLDYARISFLEWLNQKTIQAKPKKMIKPDSERKLYKAEFQSMELAPKTLEKLDLNAVIELHNKSYSTSAIARKLMSSQQTIKKLLINNGYTPNDVFIGGKRPKIDYDRMDTLIRQGFTAKEIAREMDCDISTVNKRLRTKNKPK